MSERTRRNLFRDERAQALVEYGLGSMFGAVLAAVGTFFKAIADFVVHLFSAHH